MRFLLTMNMPSKNGGPVHQVVCDHSSNSLEEFCDYLSEYEFVIVDEIYRDKRGNPYSVGDIVLNTALIGKARVVGDRPHEANATD